MRLRYRISLAIVTIMLVGALFVGSSYALWSVTIHQESVNDVETGCFQLSFTEQSDSINLTNAYPISDEKGLKGTPYTFTITNTCSIAANYNVYLNTLAVTDADKIDDSFINYSLVKTDGAVAVAEKLTQNKENLDYAHFDKTNLLKSYVIGTGTLRGKMDDGTTDSVQYHFRLWIDSSATTEINGQKFVANIASVGFATNLE